LRRSAGSTSTDTWAARPATTCPDYPVLEIAAPNSHIFVHLQLSGSLSGSAPGTLSGCVGVLVDPVVAGPTGGAL